MILLFKEANYLQIGDWEVQVNEIISHFVKFLQELGALNLLIHTSSFGFTLKD